ncbi:pyridoxamine 5'-phosphate oxidase family protein [Mycobacterium lentiflavum]|uniref:Pyridoxamine 5'-phosphate oxidase family protein n=1 Tax=Mycobacterium lentiflavum TaxID=141349 RepID=A0ABY3USS7_MYCLN|nr:pyridoxamine 5'-phosphate oxidase family protein [Mycobacterium lentiflavum]ULP42638.1 pyridoxamine 5'-phosphate oxidase family protein [Mycobacterium lentiflavum]
MITRDVEVGAVADLALAPPRAALAAVIDNDIRLLPVAVALEEPADPATSARIVRVTADSPDLGGCPVVVVADDGPQWFRLRALTVRGTADAAGDHTYRVVPERVTAWDYGALRAVPEPQSGPLPTSTSTAHDADDGSYLESPKLQAAVKNSRVMVLATRSRKGMAFAVPLWFVPQRGRLYATTSASSWTVRNLAATPQVALLLGGECGDRGSRLLVHGSARAVAAMPPPEVLARIAWRYYLQPRFAAVELRHIGLWPLRLRYYGQSQPAYVVIAPHTATECGVP